MLKAVQEVRVGGRRRVHQMAKKMFACSISGLRRGGLGSMRGFSPLEA